MTVYVFSTLSTAQAFHSFDRSQQLSAFDIANKADQLPTIIKTITIKGGANVAQQNPIDKGIHTPLGVVTSVKDEDYDWLKEHKTFQHFVKAGHLRVDDKRLDVKDAIKDMNPADKSAPLTPKKCDEDTKDKLRKTRVQGSKIDVVDASE